MSELRRENHDTTVRLAPHRKLPPYTYVPGKSPHPVSDPRGHSRHSEEFAFEVLSDAAWQSNEAYLHGFDLYHAGYYWEAHETWEGLWKLAERGSQTHRLLQGLIKLAAAGVKGAVENERGVQRHAARAAELLQSVAREQPRLCGVGVAAAAEIANSVAAIPRNFCHPIDPTTPRATLPGLPISID